MAAGRDSRTSCESTCKPNKLFSRPSGIIPGPCGSGNVVVAADSNATSPNELVPFTLTCTFACAAFSLQLSLPKQHIEASTVLRSIRNRPLSVSQQHLKLCIL
ncbi:hypothetical protein GOP47_0013329 [Adiantum capillus-veneris]|uniref:Uncharacterized protein n=1 Tax=Adiantum capillus-veneris TaxID=13818 RepID=A0A9D4ZD30_ADICA|nr:hypothetical protein GOP47_0013329 [Adiantum capillus-veneris]